MTVKIITNASVTALDLKLLGTRIGVGVVYKAVMRQSETGSELIYVYKYTVSAKRLTTEYSTM